MAIHLTRKQLDDLKEKDDIENKQVKDNNEKVLAEIRAKRSKPNDKHSQ